MMCGGRKKELKKTDDGYCCKCKFRKEEYQDRPCDFRDFGDFYNMCFHYVPADLSRLNNIEYSTSVMP